MAKTFTAQLKDIADLRVRDMRYVAAEAIQDVVEAAQAPQPSVKQTGGSFEVGKIPVDEGDLIGSLNSRIGGGGGTVGETSYVTAIAGFEVGDRLEFEWGAAHALPMEAGTSKVAGRHFVGANAARFSDFVEQRVKEVKK